LTRLPTHFWPIPLGKESHPRCLFSGVGRFLIFNMFSFTRFVFLLSPFWLGDRPSYTPVPHPKTLVLFSLREQSGEFSSHARLVVGFLPSCRSPSPGPPLLRCPPGCPSPLCRAGPVPPFFNPAFFEVYVFGTSFLGHLLNTPHPCPQLQSLF